MNRKSGSFGGGAGGCFREDSARIYRETSQNYWLATFCGASHSEVRDKGGLRIFVTVEEVLPIHDCCDDVESLVRNLCDGFGKEFPIDLCGVPRLISGNSPTLGACRDVELHTM